MLDHQKSNAEDLIQATRPDFDSRLRPENASSALTHFSSQMLALEDPALNHLKNIRYRDISTSVEELFHTIRTRLVLQTGVASLAQ